MIRKKVKLSEKEIEFIEDYNKRSFERSYLESDAYVAFVDVFKKFFPHSTAMHDGKEYNVTDPHMVADIALAKSLYWYLKERVSDYEAFPLFLQWLTQSYMTLVIEDNVKDILFSMDYMKTHKHTSQKNRFVYNDLDNSCYYIEAFGGSKRGVTHLRKCLMLKDQNTKTAIVYELWQDSPNALYFYRLKYGESEFWLTKQLKFLKDFKEEEFLWGSSMKLDFDCYNDILASPPLFKRMEGQDFNFIKHVIFEVNSLKTEIDIKEQNK
jgi:hypothetical protein